MNEASNQNPDSRLPLITSQPKQQMDRDPDKLGPSHTRENKESNEYDGSAKFPRRASPINPRALRGWEDTG